MAVHFSENTIPVSNLVEMVDSGELSLPEIQRPFVWKPVQVRDLLDSMYRGYPVGTLLFWKTLGNGGRAIGDSRVAPSLLIVDGQQRLTSLFAVVKGAEIVRKDYSRGPINIAFRPRDGTFAVRDAAIEKDPEYVSSVTEVWQSDGLSAFRRAFLKGLRDHRDLTDDDEQQIEDALDRLNSLTGYRFTAFVLSKDLDEEQVAEVFVRVNGKGVKLNQADFLLTLMSVFWDEGRALLEDFCRRSKVQNPRGPSPVNPFIQPSPDQLLKVAVAVAFRRARLREVYPILRGRDADSGGYSDESRDRQFERLKQAQAAVLDLDHWHEVIAALRTAGYRSGRMVSSNVALLYAYALYVIGRVDYKVERRPLREAIARWFFVTAMTARYSGNPEGEFEKDLKRLATVGDAAAFVRMIDEVCEQQMTEDWWTLRMPAGLESQAARSPELFGYHAALVLLDARALFSRIPVSDLFDPMGQGRRATAERHHLFPKKVLRDKGIEELRLQNQIGNMAYLEWPDNAEIADKNPSRYWREMTAHLTPDEVERQCFWHALAPGWSEMEYDVFLAERRRRIAQVTKEAWKVLTRSQPAEEPLDLGVLLSSGEDGTVEFKSTAWTNLHTGQRDRRMEDAVLKSVAGFANTDGGVLAIGIADDSRVVGLGPDIEQLRRKDLDGFESGLHDLLIKGLGPAATASLRVRLVKHDGVDACLIKVPAAVEPVYARTSAGQDRVLFVRTGNSTRQIPVDEVAAWLRGHPRFGG